MKMLMMLCVLVVAFGSVVVAVDVAAADPVLIEQPQLSREAVLGDIAEDSCVAEGAERINVVRKCERLADIITCCAIGVVGTWEFTCCVSEDAAGNTYSSCAKRKIGASL
jgi:hypothetical protein